MRNYKTAALSALTLALTLGSAPGTAEDIHIYAPSDSDVTAAPNILVILDNSANWSRQSQHWPGGITQGEAQIKALRTVLSELGEQHRVGLMLLQNDGNDKSAYVRYHIRPMNEINKGAFRELLGNPAGCVDGPNSLNDTPNCLYQNYKSNEEQIGVGHVDYSAALFEAYKYFGGHTHPGAAPEWAAGTPTSRTQFGPERYLGPVTDGRRDPAAYTNDQARYLSPIVEDEECASNYIVFVGNGHPNNDMSLDILQGVQGDTTSITKKRYTANTVEVEEHLATSSCGQYATENACAIAAAEIYGDAYAEYFCKEVETPNCSTGTATHWTTFGNSTCGQFGDYEACEVALEATHPGYDHYKCQEVGSCTYEVDLHPSRLLDNHNTCIPQGNQTANCLSYAQGAWPDYAAFSCASMINDTECHGNERKWVISAAAERQSGRTFTQLAGNQVEISDGSTQFQMFGIAERVDVQPVDGTSYTSDNNADAWARFLNRTDVSPLEGQQNVVTYTIDVFHAQQDADQTSLLQSMANVGGGTYFAATNEDELKQAFRRIFSEIQAVNSVFASSSLPVSVNTQGTYLNQVFIGMFRPDAGGGPRWMGNLKQYQFAFFGNHMQLADATGGPAINPATGFISPCARSLWSTDSGNYWDYPGSEALGSCSGTTPWSDTPDGDVVEKGGAAQRLRGVLLEGNEVSVSTNYATRNLQTCTPGTDHGCGTLTNFDSGNTAITATALGVSTTDPDARVKLIDWIRGKDVDDENNNDKTDETRPSVHGGVIHSQPAVIDYGGDIGVVAFYGADDGVFRAVNGGTDDMDGTELWGFIAPETVGRFRRLRANSPLINFPGLQDLQAVQKDYFFDGSIGVHQSSDAVWVFPTMRRGGRGLYAFDVTNPEAPTLLWRKGCFTSNTGSDANCSTDWSSIGQTWSKPQVVTVEGYDNPVLVFGGGYDTCEDTDSTVRCSGTRKGANVWFVDAETGEILRTYATHYSVPGDIFVLNDRVSGLAQYAYAVDTGGYVYRIHVGSISGTTYSDWSEVGDKEKITIASLSSTTAHERKFLFGPDVVPYRDYNAVLVGSGDREHPLRSSYACNDYEGGVTNRFFMLKDDTSVTPSADTLITDTATDGGGDLVLTNVTGSTEVTESEIGSGGWYFNLGACEQVVNKPLTMAGVVYFGTNQPAASAAKCVANLGIARGYAVNFTTGAPAFGGNRSTLYEGGGLAPSPVGGIVEVDGVKVPFLIGGVNPETGSNSPLEGQKVTIDPGSARTRVYWYKEVD